VARKCENEPPFRVKGGRGILQPKCRNAAKKASFNRNNSTCVAVVCSFVRSSVCPLHFDRERTNGSFDERRTTNDERRTTNDERRTTNDERPTTNDERPTTNDERPTTNDQRPTTNDQRPTIKTTNDTCVDESTVQTVVAAVGCQLALLCSCLCCCFVASLLRCFVALLLRCFVSLLCCFRCFVAFVASLLRWFCCFVVVRRHEVRL